MLRHDDQVRMRYAVAMNHHTDAFRRKDFANATSDSLGDDNDALREIVWDVGKSGRCAGAG
jgi:hypothetical protein